VQRAAKIVVDGFLKIDSQRGIFKGPQRNGMGSRPTKSISALCFSEEIIKYLLTLLDPVKDAKEIAQLKKDQAELAAMGRWITPIIVSLNNSALEELINPGASVRFDLDGSGLDRRWSWITPKAAWLVYDHDGSGEVTSGLQMFGSVTFWIFWRDGYDALSSLDDNGDGELRDLELRCLALWRDANSNGISDRHEVRSAADYGRLVQAYGLGVMPS
jgi:hypothetical protein